MPDKFYLTTPIYYVNARPHIGHAYTTIVADVLARRHRLLGDDTWFLTGTDEHGQKIERSAAAAGIPPQQFADQVSQSFRDLWDRMGLTYDQYIRTTDPAHKRGVQKLFTTLQERGAIYLDSYTGAYCVSDEAFVDVPSGTPCPDCGRITETVTEENYFFKLSEYQLPLLNLIESNELLIEPEARRNEVLSFLRGAVPQKGGSSGLQPAESASADEGALAPAYTALGTPYLPGSLRDLSISRSSFTWGIPVPESASQHTTYNSQPTTASHVIYVWLDALANYMTAVGYGSDDPLDQEKFQKYWPADLHIVGKEIIRFHCVYWPAFLLAAGLPLPKKVVAHGWLLFDDSKMSKSKGNIVRTETILDAFGTLCPPPQEKGGSSGLQPAESTPAIEGALAPANHHRDLFAADILRYFLLREIPFGQDGSFSFDALITRYNADLANGYGNLVSRTLKMIQQSSTVWNSWAEAAEIPPYQGERFTLAISRELRETVTAAAEVCARSLDALDFNKAIEQISIAVAATDGYISAEAPWKLAKLDTLDAKVRLTQVLYTASQAIHVITILLHPILPYATTRVWQQLGLDPAELQTPNSKLSTLEWGLLPPGTKLGPLGPIFPRADKGLAKIMADMELPKSLSSITDNTDATHPAADDLPTGPIASEAPKSKLVDESFLQPPTPADPTDPAAPPRTGSFTEPTPGTQVAGSTAVTTERVGTPSHTEAASGIFAAQAPADASPQITIDDFAKIELRVAKILVAERIPKADKLLRLEVDLGYEQRQILSGIAEYYTPEDLIGRRIVVITNLAPRKMRGLESHGMLLAASGPEGGKPILATFPESEELPLGLRLK